MVRAPILTAADRIKICNQTQFSLTLITYPKSEENISATDMPYKKPLL